MSKKGNVVITVAHSSKTQQRVQPTCSASLRVRRYRRIATRARSALGQGWTTSMVLSRRSRGAAI